MKDVIGSILDIEKKANKIVSEGKEEKKQLEKKMKADLAKMQTDINNMVETKLEQLDSDEKKDAAKSLKRINGTAERKLKAMEEFYKEKRGFWVETVFNIITGSGKSGF